VKANKARTTKAVSSKDARYDDPEDGNNKGTVANSKAGNGVKRETIMKASPGKFGCHVAVKVTVKYNVTDGGKQRKGALRTNIHDHGSINICANNIIIVTMSVQQQQRHQSNMGFG
jgi:hypothetical protein